jgi:hypothetical protein
VNLRRKGVLKKMELSLKKMKFFLHRLRIILRKRKHSRKWHPLKKMETKRIWNNKKDNKITHILSIKQRKKYYMLLNFIHKIIKPIKNDNIRHISSSKIQSLQINRLKYLTFPYF